MTSSPKKQKEEATPEIPHIPAGWWPMTCLGGNLKQAQQ